MAASGESRDGASMGARILLRISPTPVRISPTPALRRRLALVTSLAAGLLLGGACRTSAPPQAKVQSTQAARPHRTPPELTGYARERLVFLGGGAEAGHIAIVDLLRIQRPDTTRYRYLLLTGPPLRLRVHAEFDLSGPSRWPVHSGLVYAVGPEGPAARWRGDARSDELSLAFEPAGMPIERPRGFLAVGPAEGTLDWAAHRGLAVWIQEAGPGAPPAAGRLFLGRTEEGDLVVDDGHQRIVRTQGGARRRQAPAEVAPTGPGIEARVSVSPLHRLATDIYVPAETPVYAPGIPTSGKPRHARGVLIERRTD